MSYEYTGPGIDQEYQPPKSKTKRNCCLFAVGGCGCLTVTIAIVIGVTFFWGVRTMSGLMGTTINAIDITTALKRYCDEHGSYPPAYTVDENGQPLHSWRVLILPYLSASQNPFDKELRETQNLQELYDSIRLDEPWDSEYNKQFASRMPRCYLNATLKEEGKTSFQMIIGPKCISDGPGSRTADEVHANLPIVVIEANPSVEWMKPEDLQYSDLEANGYVDPGSEKPGVTCPHSMMTMPFGLAIVPGSQPMSYFNAEKFAKGDQQQFQGNGNTLTFVQIRKLALFEDEIKEAAESVQEPQEP
jgi:hypothetical protein